MLRIEEKCPHCGSENINRMNDSKWLFSIKHESELNLLTKTIDRIFLTIVDYPFFEENDFSSIRFQAFEIWNNSERCKNFKILMTNYFYKIFLEHIKKNPNKTPAPKNFWPYSYQFYLCNPVKVFDAVVFKANENPEIQIDLLIPPDQDRSILASEPMPTSLLGLDEITILTSDKNKGIVEKQMTDGHNFNDLIELTKKKSLNKMQLGKILPYIDEETRELLPLRDTDKISVEKVKYVRRSDTQKVIISSDGEVSDISSQ